MDEEKKICGAKTKTRPGSVCQNPPVAGSRRCRMHGGKSLSGPANPAFKTGAYSKHFPQKLRNLFEEASADPELMSLRSDVAVIQVRIFRLIQELETGHGPLHIWRALKDEWSAFEAAMKASDQEATQDALKAIARLIRIGSKEEIVWEQLTAALHDKSALSRSEHARLKDMQQMITAEQASLFMGALYDAVCKHVPERDRLAAIGQEMLRLSSIDRGGSSVPLPVSLARGRVVDAESVSPLSPAPATPPIPPDSPVSPPASPPSPPPESAPE